MKTIRFLFLLVCTLAALDLHAEDIATSVTSPHSEAIQLVMQARAEEIKKLDEADDWWFDTKERTWVVKRPFGPGVIDSRHHFMVTYAIEGRIVGTWSVNTQTGQVAGPNETLRIN